MGINYRYNSNTGKSTYAGQGTWTNGPYQVQGNTSISEGKQDGDFTFAVQSTGVNPNYLSSIINYDPKHNSDALSAANAAGGPDQYPLLWSPISYLLSPFQPKFIVPIAADSDDDN